MPKPGDAQKALSMVPAGAHRALPRPRASRVRDQPAARAGGRRRWSADSVVDAFRDVNAEGDIRGSSDRYLRQAAQAAIGASRAGAFDGPPNALAHVPDPDPGRARVPRAGRRRDRRSTRASPTPRRFFGRELPGDLESAAGQTTAKLDAPRNKLLRLMVESLDKVLRHPQQLDLDDDGAQARGADRRRQDGHVRVRQLPGDDAVHPQLAVRDAPAPAAAARARSACGWRSRSTRRT